MKRHPSVKRGADGHGLTDRQRSFVRQRRMHPALSAAECARRAGYAGTPKTLTEVANGLMHKVKIRMAVYAPRPIRGPRNAAERKAALQRKLLAVVRSEGASFKERLDAAEELAATLPDFYVPRPEGETARLAPDPGGGRLAVLRAGGARRARAGCLGGASKPW